MRIITGSCRGTKLNTLDGDNTRPTSERAKEAIFSILGDAVADAIVLDLFAGSGQLGLEALSRGAKHCTFSDLDKDAVRIVEGNIRKTRMEEKSTVIARDYHHGIKLMKEKANLVFLDPPYALGLIPKALECLIKEDKLQKNALIVCESADFSHVFGEKSALQSHFSVKKQTHYGIARVTVLEYTGKAEDVCH